jgi:hypothetical protein
VVNQIASAVEVVSLTNQPIPGFEGDKVRAIVRFDPVKNQFTVFTSRAELEAATKNAGNAWAAAEGRQHTHNNCIWYFQDDPEGLNRIRNLDWVFWPVQAFSREGDFLFEVSTRQESDARNLDYRRIKGCCQNWNTTHANMKWRYANPEIQAMLGDSRELATSKRIAAFDSKNKIMIVFESMQEAAEGRTPRCIRNAMKTVRPYKDLYWFRHTENLDMAEIERRISAAEGTI